jgi:hypothetical protein
LVVTTHERGTGGHLTVQATVFSVGAVVTVAVAEPVVRRRVAVAVVK